MAAWCFLRTAISAASKTAISSPSAAASPAAPAGRRTASPTLIASRAKQNGEWTRQNGASPRWNRGLAPFWRVHSPLAADVVVVEFGRFFADERVGHAFRANQGAEADVSGDTSLDSHAIDNFTARGQAGQRLEDDVALVQAETGPRRA